MDGFTTGKHQTSTHQTSKIQISKIQKLLNLASSDVEEEARTAMLKAQALMAAHDLSMEQISALGEDHEAEEEQVVEQTVEKNGRTVQYWHKLLTMVITRNFRCACLYRSYGNGTRDIVIVGMPDDVHACRETLTFSFRAATNCWTRYRKSRTFRNRCATEAAKRDYMTGFAVGLRDAFAAQVREKALVISRREQVDQYMKGLRLRSEPSVRWNVRVDRDAQQRGYEEGRRGRGGLLESRS